MAADKTPKWSVSRNKSFSPQGQERAKVIDCCSVRGRLGYEVLGGSERKKKNTEKEKASA